MTWGITEHIEYLKTLLAPGVIGHYRSFEITEIFGFQKTIPKLTTNFLSLLVAEPIEPTAEPWKPKYLNDKPIGLRGTDWKFGIKQYRVPIQHVINTLHQLDETGEWKPAGLPLKVGPLTALPPQFVPADISQHHPWNGVLKNNFWEGSHVLELFDPQKMGVKFLLANQNLLAELGEKVSTDIPLGIDGLSDRLGNVLIQLPVTAITVQITNSKQSGFCVHPIWHQNVTPRPLRVSWEMYEDSTIESFNSRPTPVDSVKFPVHSPSGGPRYVIWDDLNEVILGASAQTAFITGISMTSHIAGIDSITRNFFLPTSDGQLVAISVALEDDRKSNFIGSTHPNPREPWRSNRVFRDSLQKVQQRKEFIQYGGASGADQKDALGDIHWLLRQHGNVGAWLWDPYLDAKDVLNTLFYNPHIGADLRALTAGKEPPAIQKNDASPCGTTWKTQQQEIFEKAKGNCKSLQLEFRIREGGAGWSFHDRFLIFPSDSGGATAWSLGTSVNSFGQQHHILQKVTDGELIRQAFLDLWNKLDKPDHLVWKTT